MLSVLPRLLLCLCLVLDGIAPAFVATRMAVAFAGDVPAAAIDDATTTQADAVAMSDCGHALAAEEPPPAPPTHDDGDCLQRCLDLCLQQGHALIALASKLPLPGPAVAVSNLTLAQVDAVHAFPPLRPPIA